MTEAGRAFEAWWENHDKRDNPVHRGMKDCIESAFLAGWKRERAKAKPLVVEARVASSGGFEDAEGKTPISWIKTPISWIKTPISWMIENKVPMGAKIRITVEEV